MTATDEFFSIDIDDVVQQFDAVQDALPAKREEAMTVIMLTAEGAVKERFAPWVDGNLAGNVTGRAKDGGETGELRTNGVDYAVPQEFNHEFDHSRNPGETGERGADYIGRGIRYADAIAPDIWQKMHEEVWRNNG